MKRRLADISSSSEAKKPKGHWSAGLHSSMEDPEMTVFKDDKLVVIKDKFPKARFHFLVMPLVKIAGISHLNSSHLPLLKHMKTVGESIASKQKSSEAFRLGFHAVPSMDLLHMHVISQDFKSECLKTKKHWNSFTTDFFQPVNVILKRLEEEGKVTLDKSHFNDLLKAELKCHRCELTCASMPKLKDHIEKHLLVAQRSDAN